MKLKILKWTSVPAITLCASLSYAQPVVVNQIAAKIGTQVITQSEVENFTQTELIGDSTLRQLFATSSDWSDYLARRNKLIASHSEAALRELVKIRVAQSNNDDVTRSDGRRMAFRLTQTELDTSVRSHEAELLKEHGNVSSLTQALKEANYPLPSQISDAEYMRRYRADYKNRVLGAYRTQSYNAFMAAHFGDAAKFYTEHFYLSADMLRSDKSKAKQQLGAGLIARSRYENFLSDSKLAHLIASAQTVSADVMSLEALRKVSAPDYEKQKSVIQTKIVPMLSDTSALFAFEARVKDLATQASSVEDLEAKRREKLSEFVEKGNYMSFVEALFADAAAVLKANPDQVLSDAFRARFLEVAKQLASELAANPEALRGEAAPSFVDSLRAHLGEIETEMPQLSDYEKKWVGIYQWTLAIKAKKVLHEASTLVKIELVDEQNPQVRQDYKQRAYAQYFRSEESKLQGKWLRDSAYGSWVKVGTRQLQGSALEAWIGK